jgi:gas vesicle protein
MPLQLTPFLQTLIGGILAIVGAIVGSLITGYFLIKSHEKTEKERMRVEMFGKVLKNVYAPFQEIAEGIINQNEITNGNSASMKHLIDTNKKFILMCPEDIKKEIGILRENLKRDEQDDAIKTIETVKRKIDELIDIFVLKR